MLLHDNVVGVWYRPVVLGETLNSYIYILICTYTYISYTLLDTMF